MTIFYYIIIAMLSALLLAGALVIVFRAGEKELLTRYDYKEGGADE